MGNITIGSLLILAVISSLTIGKLVIPQLMKLKVSQSIREEGPKTHYEKAGTPTMGGFIFLIPFVVLTLLSLDMNINLTIIMLSTVGFALIGFIDDFIIVVLKRNLGLKGIHKLILQIFMATIIAVLSYTYLGSEIFIPILNQTFDLSYFYIAVMVFIITGTVNSVNLTDGLDGLSSSVTIVVATFYLIIGTILGIQSVTYASIIIIGALLGFLKYNWKPAKVFMGDTGSLALGGLIVSLAIVTQSIILLPIVGIIYFAETMSVILQVGSYKLYGKRIFRMSPLHHHYELMGLKEKEIVKKFVTVSVVFLFISLIILSI